MTVKTALAFVAAGVIAAASVAPALAAPPAGRANAVELSAQQNQDKNKKKKKPNQAQPQTKATAPKSGAQGTGKKSGGGKQNIQQVTQPTGKKSGSGKPPKQQSVVGGSGGSQKSNKVVVFKPKIKVVTAKRLRGLPLGGGGRIFVRGQNYSTWRGANYRIHYHDHWVTFVPLTALAVLAVGPRHYYPYAYIAAPRLYCEGFTEDGCLLDWREVETLQGDIIAQCVAYCPWQEY